MPASFFGLFRLAGQSVGFLIVMLVTAANSGTFRNRLRPMEPYRDCAAWAQGASGQA